MRVNTLFLVFYLEASCVRLEVELDSDSVLTQEHIDTAIKFGIDSDNRENPKKFVFSFIRKLLLQREKLEKETLNDYLDPGIKTLWQEVLFAMENSNRKLLGVQNGSLIFTLFCPTITSKQDLKDDSWIKSLENLIRKIG